MNIKKSLSVEMWLIQERQMANMEILILRKCCKKYLMLILSVLLTLSITHIPTNVDAATPYKLIYLWDKKADVGGVKFSSKRENDTGRVTIYYKINNKTKESSY